MQLLKKIWVFIVIVIGFVAFVYLNQGIVVGNNLLIFSENHQEIEQLTKQSSTSVN
jgi:hypothetical protein